jgi:hypothetical protein
MELLNQLGDGTNQSGNETGEHDGLKVKDFEAENVGRLQNVDSGHGANAVKAN